MILKKGFTLVESLVAILVLGLLLAATTRLEITSLNFLIRRREQIDRVFVIKKYLSDYFLKFSSLRKPYSFENIEESSFATDKEVVDKLQDSRVDLVRELNLISKKSSLSDFSKYVRIASCDGRWREGEEANMGQERSMKMISFVLAPLEM